MPTKTHLIVENDVFPKNARFLQFDKELRRGVDDFGYILIDPVEFLLKHDLFPEYKDTNLDAGGLCSKYLHSLSQYGMEVFTNPTYYNSEKMIIIRHANCVPGKVEAMTALVSNGGIKDMNFTRLDCKKEGCTKESTSGGYCAVHVPTVSCLFVVLVCLFVLICQCSTHHCTSCSNALLHRSSCSIESRNVKAITNQRWVQIGLVLEPFILALVKDFFVLDATRHG